MTTIAIAEISLQLAIMDAIEKGHTSAKELTEYVKSQTCIESTKRYIELIKKEFN